MDPLAAPQDTTAWDAVIAFGLPVGAGVLAVMGILWARRRWGDKSGKSEPFRF